MENAEKKISKKKSKKCPLCERGINHMTVVMNRVGEIHVHAPFGRKDLMDEFMNAIEEERKKWEIDEGLKTLTNENKN